jgi:hypothetical protein
VKRYRALSFILIILEILSGCFLFVYCVLPYAAWTESLQTTAAAHYLDSHFDIQSQEMNENIETVETEAASEVDVSMSAVPAVYTGGDTGDGLQINDHIVEAWENTMIQQEDYSNTAWQAVDNDLNTSWQEGMDDAGIGAVLEYTFDETYPINYITFYLGVWNEAEGTDYYYENNRPKTLDITIGGTSYTVDFEDSKTEFRLEFDAPVSTSSVRIELKDIYQGNSWNDTGITDIGFYSVSE